MRDLSWRNPRKYHNGKMDLSIVKLIKNFNNDDIIWYCISCFDNSFKSVYFFILANNIFLLGVLFRKIW